jgi:DNA replication and repair protein RecF
MLRLQNISLVQFKNYSNRSFQFAQKVTGICGKNGTGKTNLLDAIHYLCFTKSYFTRQDVQTVQHGSTGFRLEGHLELGNSKDSVTSKLEKAVCILREAGKKEFLLNDEPYEKFSQHIGRYPCVVIAPDDAELITGDSRERRSFLDALLCQLDAAYMQHLISYKKILEQRNSLLKTFAETNRKDFTLLDVLDNQLVKAGDFIFNKRKTFLLTFLPAAKNWYTDIACSTEQPEIIYESELLYHSLAELLKANRQKDCFAQRTTAGIHRDDLAISMAGQAFKSIASQGQRKSLLFALKLAEMEVLKQEKGFAPLLLLDDVFEKLDEERISNLLKKVCAENEGQVFITDTNAERLQLQLDRLLVKHEIIVL